MDAKERELNAFKCIFKQTLSVSSNGPTSSLVVEPQHQILPTPQSVVDSLAPFLALNGANGLNGGSNANTPPPSLQSPPPPPNSHTHLSSSSLPHSASNTNLISNGNWNKKQQNLINSYFFNIGNETLKLKWNLPWNLLLYFFIYIYYIKYFFFCYCWVGISIFCCWVTKIQKQYI